MVGGMRRRRVLVVMCGSGSVDERWFVVFVAYIATRVTPARAFMSESRYYRRVGWDESLTTAVCEETARSVGEETMSGARSRATADEEMCHKQ